MAAALNSEASVKGSRYCSASGTTCTLHTEVCGHTQQSAALPLGSAGSSGSRHNESSCACYWLERLQLEWWLLEWWLEWLTSKLRKATCEMSEGTHLKYSRASLPCFTVLSGHNACTAQWPQCVHSSVATVRAQLSGHNAYTAQWHSAYKVKRTAGQ